MFLAKLLSRNEVEVPEGLFGEEYNPTKITKREVQFKKKKKRKKSNGRTTPKILHLTTLFTFR